MGLESDAHKYAILFKENLHIPFYFRIETFCIFNLNQNASDNIGL